MIFFLACQPDIPDNQDDQDQDKNIGYVQFNFPIPERKYAPAEKVHRIDLSIAASAYDLYRGEFLISASVSDLVSTYNFKLAPGDYYFQAGITCSCLGDTCLWDGFPGGRWGTKWTLDRISIIKDEVLIKDLKFIW